MLFVGDHLLKVSFLPGSTCGDICEFTRRVRLYLLRMIHVILRSCREPSPLTAEDSVSHHSPPVYPPLLSLETTEPSLNINIVDGGGVAGTVTPHPLQC